MGVIKGDTRSLDCSSYGGAFCYHFSIATAVAVAVVRMRFCVAGVITRAPLKPHIGALPKGSRVVPFGIMFFLVWHSRRPQKKTRLEVVGRP